MSTRLGLSDQAPVPEHLAPGSVVADRYRVVSELGSGAMGAVFLAEHLTLGRRVALKTIHRALLGSQEAVTRFEREALASARIDHPNVVAATDVVRLDDGSPALVLEYVPGRSLAKRLADEGPPPLATTLALLEALASALVEAHALGIVHRDLKPENVILVERPGVAVSLKILDFGIAKLVGEAGATMAAAAPGTQLGLVYGTPRYMAPEQAVGQVIDARVDLYAAGVLAYELLTGHVPFDGEDLTAIVTRQLTERPAPLPPTVPPALHALVTRLLAPQPSERISSARDLLDALRSVSAGASSLPSTLEAVTSPQAGIAATPLSRADAARRSSRLLAIAIGALVVAGGAFMLARRASTTVGGDSSTFALALTPNKASSDELARAKKAGRSALEQLAFRFPEDAAVVRALIDAAHAEGAPLLVAKHLDALATLDPAAAEALVPVAEASAQKSDEASAVLVPLLATRLGAAGVEALVGLADRKGPAKKPSAESLATDAIRAKLSPASLALVDARAAKTCADRKGLLPRLVEDADARIAPLTASWSSDRGCGFLSLGDCNPCLRTKEARTQLAELKARFADAGAPRR